MRINKTLTFTITAKTLVSAIALLLVMTCASAATDEGLCSELSEYFSTDEGPTLPNPSRGLTEAEDRLIKKSKIDLFDYTDYQSGAYIVDADNDGRGDVVAWNIAGSGRFVTAELFDIQTSQDERSSELVLSMGEIIGTLQEPRFIRFKDVNYLVSTDTGGRDGINVSRISKAGDGGDAREILCSTQTFVKPDTSCRHPACRELRDVIENKSKNQPFINVEWPHKYLAPAGLEVFFSSEWSKGDFDNIGKPTSIWRIGREGYLYQNIHWALLGQGDKMPEVDPRLRPTSDGDIKRRVLPGLQHDRLRRTLIQQSKVLSNQLNRQISLPSEGEFFLFKANGNRTYWAWDFGESGEAPLGKEIHILYTNAKKSDYIGLLRIKRNLALEPCTSDCAPGE